MPTFMEVSPLSQTGVASPAGSQHSLDIDHSFVRALVKDLHHPRPSIYWTDLLLTSFVGWSAAFTASVSRPMSVIMLLAVVIAIFALYRGLSFLHEISHQNSRTLPGFETVWNFLIGYPLLMPSFFYVGVHGDHHRLSTYGTVNDPEYLPFAKSWLMTTIFALDTIIVPPILLLRFLLLTPVSLLSPSLANWVVAHASSLTMNIHYRREPTPELVARVQRHSMAIWMLWMNVLTFACCGLLPWRVFLVWLTIHASISFLNALRTLGAHAYESDGTPLDRAGQLLDSIDTPGRFWTELWAPVGLRYHALHHYFPGIPYHNLGEGYRRLAGPLPLAANYRKMTSESLFHSLQELLDKGRGRWEGRMRS